MVVEFPVDEYHTRAARVQQEMAQQGLDALLLSAETSLRYLTGVVSPFSEVSPVRELALLPTGETEEAILLRPSDAASCVVGSYWMEDVRAYPPDETSAMHGLLDALVALITVKHLHKARIGMDLGLGFRRNLAARDFDLIRERLPGIEAVDATPLLAAARQIKTPAEVDVLREACLVTCAGYQAGLRTAWVGVSEKELITAVCAGMMEAGPQAGRLRQWFLTINASRELDIWCNPLPTDHRLRPGDPVMLDGGYILRGYHTDCIRWGCVGPLSPEEQRLYDLVGTAAQAAVDSIRPGITCASVFQTAIHVFRQAGIDEHVLETLDGFGHGVGLDVREGPYIEPDEATVVQPGMVLAIEPWLPNLARPSQAPDLFAIENMVTVTETGYELLTPLPTELWVN